MKRTIFFLALLLVLVGCAVDNPFSQESSPTAPPPLPFIPPPNIQVLASIDVDGFEIDYTDRSVPRDGLDEVCVSVMNRLGVLIEDFCVAAGQRVPAGSVILTPSEVLAPGTTASVVDLVAKATKRVEGHDYTVGTRVFPSIAVPQ